MIELRIKIRKQTYATLVKMALLKAEEIKIADLDPENIAGYILDREAIQYEQKGVDE